MQDFDGQDGRQALRACGEGPLVVFVHGTPSSSHEFRGVMAALPDHRCLALDHLGFGGSDKPPTADYSVTAHQRRFSHAMDTLAVDDAVFVLHDFGASIAAPWLLANPERVRGIVLANTFLWPATGLITWILRFYATRLGRWLYRVANVSLRVLMPASWGTHRPLTPALRAEYLAPFPHPDDRHALSALPGELIGETLAGLSSRAAELGQWPIRAVWGMKDPAVGSAELARWRTLLPDLQVDEVALAGHFVADEAPDRVAAAVRALTPSGS
jgi:haloalkane dehalogenase